MNVKQAVEFLWRSGFRANASTTFPNEVVVLDPVIVMSGSERWTEYKRVTLRPDQVTRFVLARS